LRDSDDALHVDWCELTTTDATGRELFRSAWATLHIVTTETVGAIVRRAAAAGKSRVKSTIRSRRRATTSSIIWPWQAASVRTTATLILLAYLVHTTLHHLDRRYRAVRAQLPSRQTFFEHFRVFVQYLPFESWDHLFDCIFDGLPTRTVQLPGAAKHRIEGKFGIAG